MMKEKPRTALKGNKRISLSDYMRGIENRVKVLKDADKAEQGRRQLRLDFEVKS